MPSPARVRTPVFVVALSLAAALVGTAIAEPGASTSAKKVTTKKVKKISKKQADKQIDKRAPDLSVASAKTADSADSAKTANSATTASSANPIAYARVAANGTVSRAKGITNANVTKGGIGAYCLHGLGLNLKGGQVTPDGGGPKFSVSGSFEIGDTYGSCPGVPNLQAVVTTSDSTPAFDDLPFYLTLYE